jgi:hypothetical protein
MSKYLHMSFRDPNSVKQKRIPWFTEGFVQLDDKGTLNKSFYSWRCRLEVGVGIILAYRKVFYPTHE